MSGNNDRPKQPEDYEEHECLWHFIDNEDEEYETIECTICGRIMSVSTDPERRESHGQIWTGLGSPHFGPS